jgi:hypothetical protein
MYAKVKDHDNFIRDMNSKAVLKIEEEMSEIKDLLREIAQIRGSK